MATHDGGNFCNSMDPDIPLGPHYFTRTGQTTWMQRTGESTGEQLAGDRPPEFRTVLSLAEPYPEGDIDPASIRYSGPLYIDLDAGAIDDGIRDFKRMLRKLTGQFDLDLEQVRLFATGGRGFHLEIPQACFMGRIEARPHLPKIYGEMVKSFSVDSLDERVYSSGKGRMWRVPNRQRANGLFKTPITPTEAFAMTPAIYAEICSTPRPWPRLRPATLNTKLALEFSDASARVLTAERKRGKIVRIDHELQARFGKSFAPSLLPIVRGEVQSPVGFNRVAMQVSLFAHAVGMTVDQMIAECAGLISRHQSDGRRYNTPASRLAELRHQFSYTKRSNYVASVGGIKSILPRGFRCCDLQNLGGRP